MNYETLMAALRNPFSFKEIDWKLQVLNKEKTKGLAVAYLDARAIQNRLDDTVGTFNWKCIYSLWQENSQLCGLSIFYDDRNEWVTKYDGAENSDIEPIKGGLSDSFKRVASLWGIGRYLYNLDGVWVDIEPKGKSYAITQDQLSKLEKKYNEAIKQLYSVPLHLATPISKPVAPTSSQQDTPNPSNDTSPSSSPAATNASNTSASRQNRFVRNTGKPDDSFMVKSVKPSGKSSQVLELMNNSGELITAYIKSGDPLIVAGLNLNEVKIERKTSDHGNYNLIISYKAAA